MAIALVTSAVAHMTDPGWTINGGPTADLNTTTATFYIAGVTSFGNGGGGNTTTLSDNLVNTWFPLTQYGFDYGGGSTFQAQLFYAYDVITGTAHHFTAARTNGNLTLGVIAFSGTVGNPFDGETGAVVSTGATSLATGSITPSRGGDVFVTVAYPNDGIGTAIGSGFTLLFTVPGNGSTVQSFGLAYKIKSAGDAAAENPTWSWTNSGACFTGMAAFKAPASSSIPMPFRTAVDSRRY